MRSSGRRVSIALCVCQVFFLFTLKKTRHLAETHSMEENDFMSHDEDERWQKAVECGDIDNVRIGLEGNLVDPTYDRNRALRIASRKGYYKIVDLLMADARVSGQEPRIPSHAELRCEQLVRAAGSGDIDLVRALLQNELVDPSYNDSQALVVASANGHSDIVQLLLSDPRVDPSRIRWINEDGDNNTITRSSSDSLPDLEPIPDNRVSELRDYIANMDTDVDDEQPYPVLVDNSNCVLPSLSGQRRVRCEQLVKAAGEGDFDLARRLIYEGLADPEYEYNAALVAAAENGHENIVRLLMSDKRVDPCNVAIVLAAREGHASIVAFLLEDERTDPCYFYNCAIGHAYQNGHETIVRMLYKDKRFKVTPKVLDWATVFKNPAFEDFLRRHPTAPGNKPFMDMTTADAASLLKTALLKEGFS